MPDERKPINFKIELTPEGALSTPERKSALERIRDATEKIRSLDTDNLRRDELGTTYNFADAIPAVGQLLELLCKALEGDVYQMPLSGLLVTANALDKFLNVVVQVERFQPTGENPGAAHESLLTDLRGSYDRYIADIAPWLGFVATRGNGPQKQSLAPASTLRDRIVPPAPPTNSPTDCAQASNRRTWADLLERTFAVDVLRCPHCGDRRRRIALITDPFICRKLLRHIGARHEPLPLAPARPPPQQSLHFA